MLETRGGETEFIERLFDHAGFPEDLQPLANCGHDILVHHNGLKKKLTLVGADFKIDSRNRALYWKAGLFEKVACRSDGWC